jgi:endonuclease YncB( thermonuclease family)
MLRSFIFLMCFTGMTVSHGFAELLLGRCQQVVDCKTVVVRIGESDYRVQQAGVSCPAVFVQYEGDLAEQARMNTLDLILGKLVVIEVLRWEQDDSIVGRLFPVSDKDIGFGLVKQGLATVDGTADANDDLRFEENLAVLEGIGVWQEGAGTGFLGSTPLASARAPTASTTRSRSAPVSSGRCMAITKKGTRCKRNASPGSSYCWQHGG